jgi:DNA adenine methylase
MESLPPTFIKQAKPFLKWAGGKRQLLKALGERFPEALKEGTIKNYYEPFLGSGAVFFDIIQQYPIEKAFLFDVNPALVTTYRVLQSAPAALIRRLKKMEKDYRSRTAENRAAFFYEQRAAFNALFPWKPTQRAGKKQLETAALFIFLNKTCYNGLYRVNASGLLNTPAGAYKNPVICDEENLLQASRLLSAATIQLADFSKALKNIEPASFVYFDPPYRPVSKTAYFTAYNQSGFGDERQQALADLYRRLDKQEQYLMLSNADSADGFFDELYKGFSIERVPAKRMINTRVQGRGFVDEIVVTNYPRR